VHSAHNGSRQWQQHKPLLLQIISQNLLCSLRSSVRDKANRGYLALHSSFFLLRGKIWKNKLKLHIFIWGISGVMHAPYLLTVYFQKWANARRWWAADQHLLRSYKRFECNQDLKLSEVRCLEYRRSFTARRAIFTSSSRSRRQFVAQHPPHGLVVASPWSVTRHAFPLTRLN